MKIIASVFMAAGLLFLMPNSAFAGPVFSGETFAFSGTSTQILPSAQAGQGFTGLLTLGSLVPSTTDWTLTAYNVTIPGLPALTWTFTGLSFDASNNTVFGTSTAPYTDSSSYLITTTFIDGNNSTDTYTIVGSNSSENSSGLVSYTVTPTPEPSTGFLVLLGFGLAAIVIRSVHVGQYRT